MQPVFLRPTCQPANLPTCQPANYVLFELIVLLLFVTFMMLSIYPFFRLKIEQEKFIYPIFTYIPQYSFVAVSFIQSQ